MALVVASAAAVLVPVSPAGAVNEATHVVAFGSGSVTGMTNPNPAAPFNINATAGVIGGLVVLGAFTAGGATGSGTCAGSVQVDPVSFTVTAQNLLTGYGTIDGDQWGVRLRGVGLSTCSRADIGRLVSGAFVRAGTVWLGNFRLDLVIGSASGTTTATFVFPMVPGHPLICPGIPANPETCAGFHGAVLG